MENKKKTDKRKLTELEGTVLGLIGVKGPCTPYAIRKEFKKSPSLFWSGSAGTIYPIIERLEQQKLINYISTKNDLRGGKLYVLTKIGEKILKEWYYQPKSALVTETPPDPLRNRIELLSFLPSQIRKEFLQNVMSELENQLAIYIRDCENSQRTDFFEYISSRGCVLHAEARLKWIREIITIIDTEDY